MLFRLGVLMVRLRWLVIALWAVAFLLVALLCTLGDWNWWAPGWLLRLLPGQRLVV